MILIVIGLSSCVIETFDDPGNPITFNTETTDFNSLEIKSIFDIVLVQDSGNYITFECYANQRVGWSARRNSDQGRAGLRISGMAHEREIGRAEDHSHDPGGVRALRLRTDRDSGG